MTPDDKRYNPDRRRFIKAVGVTGVAGLAGCSGDGDSTPTGDGGDTDTEDGSGDGGSDGDTTGGVQDDLTVVTIEKTPQGPEAPPFIWAINTGTLFQKGLEAGYEFQVEETWRGPALFASGQLDMAMMAGFESILMAQERDMELSLAAGIARSGSGALTREGGPYDPASTGGPQASIDKLVEQGGTFAHYSWAGGYIPPTRLIIEGEYGHAFSEEESAFPVQITPLATLAPHAAEGNVDVSLTGPGLGGEVPEKLRNDVLSPVFWITNELQNLGYGTPPTSKGVITKRDFAQEHPDAVRAVVESWQEGVDWMYDNPSELIENDAYRQVWGGPSEENAQWMWDWGFDPESGGEISLNVPIVLQQVGYDQETRDNHAAFLDQVAELGFVPDNWNDYLDFVVTR